MKLIYYFFNFTINYFYFLGAQYYSLKEVMKPAHGSWVEFGMVRPWFRDAKGKIVNEVVFEDV